MTPLEIIARARRLAGRASINTYTDQDGLDDLNQVKNELWNRIVDRIKDRRYWQEWTGNLVTDYSPGQIKGEYTLEAVTTNSAGTKNLDGVWICYDGKSYDSGPMAGSLHYTKATEVFLPSMPHSWDVYQQNQPISHPIYYVSDNSFFIAPVPVLFVENGIKMQGVRNIPDYTALTTQAQMVIPTDQHETLVWGLVPYVYYQKGQIQEGDVSQAKYEKKKNLTLDSLSDRVSAPFMNPYPTDTIIDSAQVYVSNFTPNG